MLKITEVLPNPTGKDTNNEFIEITNFDTSPIDLKNFSLDDGKKGSKPYKIKTTTILKPNESRTFYNKETKIALNNSNDEARIFDPNNNLVDSLKYEKITEGKSISYVEIKSAKNSKHAILQTDPTPNHQSESLYKLDGKITENSQTQFTLIENSSNKQLTISYTSSTKELSSLTFAEGTEISLLASRKSNENFTLLDYKILHTPTTTQTQSKQTTASFPLPAILFPIIILLIILTLLIKRNRIKSCKQL